MADGKIFLFRFAVEGFVFQFDQQTIDRLSAFVERSNLSSMTVDDVYKSQRSTRLRRVWCSGVRFRSGCWHACRLL